VGSQDKLRKYTKELIAAIQEFIVVPEILERFMCQLWEEKRINMLEPTRNILKRNFLIFWSSYILLQIMSL